MPSHHGKLHETPPPLLSFLPLDHDASPQVLAHDPSLLGLLTSLSQEDNRSSGLYHVSKPPSGRVATRRQSPPSSHSGQVLAVSGVGLARQMVERRGPGRVLQMPGGGGG